MKAAFLSLVAAAALLVSTNTADARPIHWRHGGYGHRYYGGWGGGYYGRSYYGGWGGVGRYYRSYYPGFYGSYYGGYYPGFGLGYGYYNWPYTGRFGWGGWYW